MERVAGQQWLLAWYLKESQRALLGAPLAGADQLLDFGTRSRQPVQFEMERRLGMERKVVLHLEPLFAVSKAALEGHGASGHALRRPSEPGRDETPVASLALGRAGCIGACRFKVRAKRWQRLVELNGHIELRERALQDTLKELDKVERVGARCRRCGGATLRRHVAGNGRAATRDALIGSEKRLAICRRVRGGRGHGNGGRRDSSDAAGLQNGRLTTGALA